jgi:protein-S-isoprenylcysteine O-methyltransferase Ste14
MNEKARRRGGIFAHAPSGLLRFSRDMVVRGSIVVALALASACGSRCIVCMSGASPLDGAPAGHAILTALLWRGQHV